LALGEAFDGRADIYALGCVAYFLLTGRTVFEAGNALQVIAKHLHETPIPPSQRGELAIPPAVDRVVLDCLAKSPAARPSGADSLARALASIDLAPWGEPEAARWWNQHQPA
jgi:serine/threonine-protein kinase